uniref:Uncharacterized protein n=1 Tax=Alexandrium catenella TaxID=2925 RepID=A0A7S1PJY1_ALECA
MQSPMRVVLLAAAMAVAPALATRSRLLPYNDPCPFGYGTNCGGGGEIDSATKAQVASILGGILKGLTSHKALVQDSGSVVAKAAAPEVAANAGQLPEPVKGALQSLLATLQKRGQASAAKALGGMISGGADHPIDSQTKEKVAAILEGIIRNLSSHK